MARNLTLDHLGPDTYHAVNVRTLCNVFTNKQIKDRARSHTERLFYGGSIKTPMGRGMRRMVEQVMKEEYQYIKTHIRVVQRKPPRKKAAGPRPANPYKVFCDEMKKKYEPHTLVGKLQEMVQIAFTHTKSVAAFISACKVIYTLTVTLFALILVAEKEGAPT